ncbi:phage head morphogenesis protein, SPP1 gp7 family [Rhodovulum sulfidophilum]|uniref:Phage head morphogenesis protein, SPP1 gp7 family n=1 Tax=Rhodovulum sulfidophilum TaxID=35806 RepID=A0A0D6AWJ6_RHOSU|nr:phage head morphogenesis protein, SPP1 gp7 family [Rhodovulum sulfidophilum]
MCEACLKVNAAHRYDPTRTTTLRRQFEAAAARRFRNLAAKIREEVDRQDGFGLKTNRGRFDQPRSDQKVAAFMDWLQQQQDAGILEVRRGERLDSAGSRSWASLYVRNAYQKGIAQAASRMRAQGAPVAPEWVEKAFTRPFHVDRVALAYTRAYSDLRGITDAMDQQISRTLAEGLSQGLGPREISRALTDRVHKIGITRARMMARTEVIRAHADASLNAYQEAGVSGVAIEAEFATAGDNAVCPQCEALARGGPYTLDKARGLIPVHPNCRCAWVPIVPRTRRGETSAAAQAAAQGRPMTAAQAMQAMPVARANSHNAFDGTPEPALRVIQKTPDLKGMVKGKPGAYMDHEGRMSMGKHTPGTVAYKRTFRHEFGHHIDRNLGDGRGFASFAAVDELAADNKALETARSGMFRNDRAGSTALRKTIAKNEAAAEQEFRRAILAADAGGYVTDAKRILDEMTPLGEDGVKALYGVNEIRPTDAIAFVAAWNRKDVYQLLHDLPSRFGRRVLHDSPLAGMQDVFEAGTAGKIRIAFGHGEGYYKTRLAYDRHIGAAKKIGARTFTGSQLAEAFANWFEAYGSETLADYQTFKHLWPSMSQRFEEIIGGGEDG